MFDLLRKMIAPVALLSLSGAFLLMPTPATAQTGISSNFDHFTTGFPLEGAHRTVDCERCHVGGIFAGAPRECVTCHTQGGLIKSTAVPVDHILSTQQCEDCHRQTTFVPVTRVDHLQVIGSCGSCHNGRQAVGKSINHPPSSNECDNCHQTTAWLPAGFDHRDVTGNCFSCHNGSIATGKNVGHITTTNICEGCHLTTVWVPPVQVDHVQVLGSCSTCHNNVIAEGKSPDHIPSGDNCEDCHTTRAWSPASAVAQVVTQMLKTVASLTDTERVGTKPERGADDPRY